MARTASHPKVIARRAWLVSLMLHAAALAALLFMAIPKRTLPGLHAERRIVLQADVRDAPTLTSDATADLVAGHGQATPANPEGAAWDGVMRSAQSPESKPSSESKTFLQKQIDRSIEQSKQRPSEDNLDRLNQLSRDLRRNSRSQNIDEMAEYLGGMLTKRVSTPVADSEARPFDADTAQLHDVLKSEGDDGTTLYTAVMIDAQGVLRSVEMDAETGKQLYRTMQLIRSNPLLEQVYRKIVMGILDQVLKDAESTP